jgi:NitT/TauT family transport system substrate-binding protein
MKTMANISTAVVLLTVTLLLGCTSQPTKPPDEVRLQLKWVHQAQFAGFYMAQEKGYYARENLKVNFVEGGQGIDLAQRIISGQADFGVVAPEEILIKRSQGTNIVAIAAIYRRSAAVFLAMADSGIVRPQDFLGKTIAMSGVKDFEVQLPALMRKLGLDVSKVKVIPFDTNYVAFTEGDVEITGAYATSGLIRLRQKGLKLNLIWPSDYGIHFYSDTLATTGKTIAENPDLVTRFLRASLKGWQDAIEDYQQAAEVTMKYATGLYADQQLETTIMEALLPLVHTGEDQIGWMKPATWDGMYQTLLEQGLLATHFDVNQAYTMRFLQEIYREMMK